MSEAPSLREAALELGPAAFAFAYLGKKKVLGPDGEVLQDLTPYSWQADVINPFAEMDRKRVKVTAASPNGGGRSSYCVADLAIWVLVAFPLGRVTITTVSGDQLDSQIWPAIEAHKNKFPQWKWREREVTTETGGSLKAFVTDEPARAEGYHRLPGATRKTGPHLMVVDEAKNFREDMFVAVDRCTYDGLLLCSSTGLMEGRFFQSHTEHDGYIRVKAGLLQCPHIPQEKIDDIIRTYGKESPVTKSILHAEFMNFDGTSKFVFQMEQLNAAKASDIAGLTGDTVAYCDFAAGGDENVLAVRRGNKVSIIAAWRDEDTMRATYRFVHLFREQKLTPTQIYGDDGGLGHSMIDAMGELGWKINRVDNGATSNTDGYQNRGAEFWHECAGMVRRGEIILPLGDDVLFKQLSGRRVAWGPRGLGVEPKKDMAKRGAASPDRADAVCAAAVLKDTIAQWSEAQRIGNRFNNYAVPFEQETKSSYAHLEAMI